MCSTFCLPQSHHLHNLSPFSSKKQTTPSQASQFVLLGFKENVATISNGNPVRTLTTSASLLSNKSSNGGEEEFNSSVSSSTTTQGSGTSARARRLLKIREDKRRREFDRLHNYPSWAKVMEDACKHDSELRAVLGDSIGDPEQMRKKLLTFSPL